MDIGKGAVKILGQIRELAGIEHLTPHALQHCWAFEALRYAERLGISNESIILFSDLEDDDEGTERQRNLIMKVTRVKKRVRVEAALVKQLQGYAEYEQKECEEHG